MCAQSGCLYTFRVRRLSNLARAEALTTWNRSELKICAWKLLGGFCWPAPLVVTSVSADILLLVDNEKVTSTWDRIWWFRQGSCYQCSLFFHSFSSWSTNISLSFLPVSSSFFFFFVYPKSTDQVTKGKYLKSYA